MQGVIGFGMACHWLKTVRFLGQLLSVAIVQLLLTVIRKLPYST